jgi:hypothetical protein
MKIWWLKPGKAADEATFVSKIRKAENNFEIVVLEI